MPGWPAMSPAADPLQAPRLALVVATNTYTDPGLRQLRAPARDAEDLTQVLADPGIGGFAVTTVIDQPSYQVRLAIEDFLDGRGTGDLLLVYLSCHGLLDARRQLYFAAADTRKDRLGSTGVEAAWVTDQLEHCRARRQVLILDSCFSGAFAHGAKGDADVGLQDRFLGQGRGRVILTSSNAYEYSFEGDPTDAAIQAGSVFTSALVRGLRTGAADIDHDGLVSIDDTYAYVFDQVQAAGAAQTPQRWLYGAEGKILLARNPAGPRIIPTPLPDSLRAGLESPYKSIRISGVTELGEWLTSGDPARAATARHHLQEVAGTDMPDVANIARTLLGNATEAEQAEPCPPAQPLRTQVAALPTEDNRPAAQFAASHRAPRDEPGGLAVGRGDVWLVASRRQQVRSAIDSTIHDLAKIADWLDLRETAFCLREAGEQLRSDTFNLMVMGRMKNGKSTLVNALLASTTQPVAMNGRGLMAVGAMPTTAVLTAVHYADTPSITAERIDGSSELWSFDKYLRDSALTGDHEENERLFGPISEFQIGFPAALCQAGVTVVDSPGTDEHPARTMITHTAALRADAAIRPYRSDVMMGEKELEEDAEVRKAGTRVFTVVNVWGDNQVDDRMRAYVWNRYVRDHLGGPKWDNQDLAERDIFFVHAQDAFLARMAGDTAGMERSGLGALERRLNEFLTTERFPAHVHKHATSVIRLADLIDEHIGQRKAAFRADQNRLNRPEDLERNRGTIADLTRAVAAVAQHRLALQQALDIARQTGYENIYNLSGAIAKSYDG